MSLWLLVPNSLPPLNTHTDTDTCQKTHTHVHLKEPLTYEYIAVFTPHVVHLLTCSAFLHVFLLPSVYAGLLLSSTHMLTVSDEI